MVAVKAPSDSLAPQRLALVRLFFYLPETLWVTRTVTEECARIQNVERASLHQSFINVLFGERPLQDPEAVEHRAAALRCFHRGKNDCRIVAEAEDVGHSVLLTFDATLWRNLSPHAEIALWQPADYWQHVAVPIGVRPNKVPTLGNPLENETWWRW
jgi:hypothetical protein